jgi:hypothetical protein
MAIQNPPLTDDSNLNFTLLELITLVNNLEQKNLTLIENIRTSTDFAQLKTKVDK